MISYPLTRAAAKTKRPRRLAASGPSFALLGVWLSFSRPSPFRAMVSVTRRSQQRFRTRQYFQARSRSGFASCFNPYGCVFSIQHSGTLLPLPQERRAEVNLFNGLDDFRLHPRVCKERDVSLQNIISHVQFSSTPLMQPSFLSHDRRGTNEQLPYRAVLLHNLGSEASKPRSPWLTLTMFY